MSVFRTAYVYVVANLCVHLMKQAGTRLAFICNYLQ